MTTLPLHPSLRRRTMLGRLAAGAGMGWLASASAATVQTARLVLPLAPGGAMDALGRGLAQELGNRLGLSFIVENRAGAGGNIATEYVAGEKPDGRTLLLTSNAFVANTTLYEGRVHYDPVRSFAPVSIVATSPAVIVVRGDGAVPDLAALLRLARARGVTVGTPGIGNGNHLALVKMQRAVDGELRQQANTDDLILDVAALIVFASSFYTLHPGDVILTGTPQGVSPIVAGNTMTARMQGIGSMDVKVTKA